MVWIYQIDAQLLQALNAKNKWAKTSIQIQIFNPI